MVVYNRDKKELTIPIGWDELSTPDEQGYEGQYFTMEVTDTTNGYGLLYIRFTGALSGNTIYYSLNGKEWQKYSGYIPVTDGNIIRFKANNSTYFINNSSRTIISGDDFLTGVKIYGNIASLFYGDDFKGHTEPLFLSYLFWGCTIIRDAENLVLPSTTLMENGYAGLFLRCSALKKAPKLPCTNLASFCYSDMFSYTSIEEAPELPATTLAEGCYSTMFGSCPALKSAPELPATTLVANCYDGMFSNCVRLTVAPELPATTLADTCYRTMFSGCSRLVNAPAIPATTLPDMSCYKMYRGCSNLEYVPDFSATTVGVRCCDGMFENCYKLTTAPALPAETLADAAYRAMFSGCRMLNYIKCLAVNRNFDYATRLWTSGVAATGTFVKAANAEWGTGEDGIPEGWTVETE